jgi:transcriptional regulator with GAF, ATPase, and Fis domain
MSDNSFRDELAKRIKELEKESFQQIQVKRDIENELKKIHTLYDLAIAMSAENSPNKNLQRVVDEAKKLIGTDTSYIVLYDETKGDVCMHSFTGIRTEAFRKLRIPSVGKI